MAFDSLERRLAARVASYAQALAGQCGLQQSELYVPLRQEDLANAVAATVRSVQRVLARWREANIVRAGRGGFYVLDHRELARVAGDVPAGVAHSLGASFT